MHLDPCRCCATGLWCSGWSHPSSCCGTSRWLCGSNRETETLVTFTWFLSHTDDQATTCGKLTDLEPLRRVSGLCWAAVWFSSQSSCFCGAPRLCRTDLPPAVCCNQRFRSEMSESEWRALVSCAHVNFQGESGNFSALSRLHTQRGVFLVFCTRFTCDVEYWKLSPLLCESCRITLRYPKYSGLQRWIMGNVFNLPVVFTN